MSTPGTPDYSDLPALLRMAFGAPDPQHAHYWVGRDGLVHGVGTNKRGTQVQFSIGLGDEVDGLVRPGWVKRSRSWDPLPGVVARAQADVDRARTTARNTAARKRDRVRAAHARLARAERDLTRWLEVEAGWSEAHRETALQFVEDGMTIPEACETAWRVLS